MEKLSLLYLQVVTLTRKKQGSISVHGLLMATWVISLRFMSLMTEKQPTRCLRQDYLN
ncbi:Uncharacterised protein [Mycobacterium tuberculosis]|nr:Uncharacterised protein [Mycobacterium tuberculosis]